MGAQDDVVKGQSTFMVEMTETKTILSNATSRSLVILDELGRGTSTHDGTAVAFAVLHHLATQVKCHLLFVTHFPELAQITQTCANIVQCAHMGFLKVDDQLVFLYTLASGLADRSYGLNVARLAGLPPSVLAIAESQSKVMESPRMALLGPEQNAKDLQIQLSDRIMHIKRILNERNIELT
jgi:DNA mismatch repair protein MSH3